MVEIKRALCVNEHLGRDGLALAMSGVASEALSQGSVRYWNGHYATALTLVDGRIALFGHVLLLIELQNSICEFECSSAIIHI